MLKVILSATDDLPAVQLSMEHSLVSMSKWEQKHQKPFFSRESKTEEEMQSYLECMVLESDYPSQFYKRLTNEQYVEIGEYINAPATATTFSMPDEKKGPGETVTTELVYWWLLQFQIPFQPTETWHFNRLMTLVKVCGVKSSKPKKMNKQQMAEHYRKLNEERRQQSGSAG